MNHGSPIFPIYNYIYNHSRVVEGSPSGIQSSIRTCSSRHTTPPSTLPNSIFKSEEATYSSSSSLYSSNSSKISSFPPFPPFPVLPTNILSNLASPPGSPPPPPNCPGSPYENVLGEALSPGASPFQSPDCSLSSVQGQFNFPPNATKLNGLSENFPPSAAAETSSATKLNGLSEKFSSSLSATPLVPKGLGSPFFPSKFPKYLSSSSAAAVPGFTKASVTSSLWTSVDELKEDRTNTITNTSSKRCVVNYLVK